MKESDMSPEERRKLRKAKIIISSAITAVLLVSAIFSGNQWLYLLTITSGLVILQAIFE